MPLTNVYLFTLTGITMGNEYPLQNAILRKDTLERDTGCYARFVKVLKLDRILSTPVVIGEG
jgi:hypothetical protein